MYRQITSAGLVTPSLHASPLEAYQDVLAAWRTTSRTTTTAAASCSIGHSQGAYILKHLSRTVVDRSPAQRRRLVSAILLGGQVLVGKHEPRGRRLHPRAAVRVGVADRLRRRVLELRRRPAARRALRPGQPLDACTSSASTRPRPARRPERPRRSRPSSRRPSPS